MVAAGYLPLTAKRLADPDSAMQSFQETFFQVRPSRHEALLMACKREL